jgi:hypothetical protein
LRGQGETGPFHNFDLVAAHRDGNKSEIRGEACFPCKISSAKSPCPIGSLVHGLVHAVTSGTKVTIWLQYSSKSVMPSRFEVSGEVWSWLVILHGLGNIKVDGFQG